MSFIGVPVSYIFIYASKYAFIYFEGELWPIRFVGFTSGTLIMAILTYIHLGEGINLKAGVTLLLALLILLIQILWK